MGMVHQGWASNYASYGNAVTLTQDASTGNRTCHTFAVAATIATELASDVASLGTLACGSTDGIADDDRLQRSDRNSFARRQ